MATLLQDDFSDANGTDMSGKALDVGTTWTEHNGTWATQSGKAEQTAFASVNYVCSADAGAAAVTITVDVVTPAGTSNFYAGGISARVTDQNNGWFCGLEDDGGGVTEYLYIIERNASTNTVRATVNAPGLAGTTAALTVACSGNTITLSSGGFSCQYTSATFNNTATRHGMVVYRDSTYGPLTFDNFLVTSAAAAVGAFAQMSRRQRSSRAILRM